MLDDHEKAMAATVGMMGQPARIAHQDQELIERAVECFGDLDKALRWLQTPSAALRGMSPLRLAADPNGRRIVFDELGRIEHGIFA